MNNRDQDRRFAQQMRKHQRIGNILAIATGIATIACLIQGMYLPALVLAVCVYLQLKRSREMGMWR